MPLKNDGGCSDETKSAAKMGCLSSDSGDRVRVTLFGEP
jgi:hypothetical protein